jgi:putative hemolysin
MMTWIIALLIIFFLISINALYVAAEFSTVSARRSKLVQIAAEGNALARVLVPIVRDRRQLDTYVATCQIGITVSSLLLGFFGQSRLTPYVASLISSSDLFTSGAVLSITAAGVLLFLTTIQVILGELVPKSIGIQYPEQLALATILPMRWSTFLFKPLIWILNGSGRLILRLIGFSQEMEDAHTHVHTPREIMMLFEESSAGGQLDIEERRLLKNSLELREIPVRQVMIPRTRMLSATVDQTCEELLRLLADSPFSRLPLFEGTVDNVIGMVHLKDLLCLQIKEGAQDVRQAMRPVLFVPESTLAGSVFALLQNKRYHVAIVLDEYGGTSGFVTLEDLIEEIFGELQDEFDEQSIPPIRLVSDNWVEVRGDMIIDELNEALGLFLSSEEVDTIGGWVVNALGQIPEVGAGVNYEENHVVVEQMQGNAVTLIRIKVTPQQVERLNEWIL